jgi:hypothetical protein
MATATEISVAQALEAAMKRKVLVIGGIAATALLAGGWALAQSNDHGPGRFGPPFMRGEGGMGPGMHGMMGQGMHGQMGPGMRGQMGHGGPGLTFADPARIDTLKTELGITPAQEPAWAKYTKALQDAAITMRTTRESIDPATISKMTPQERFAFVSKIREQAQKQFETVKTSVDELLATLDEAQKIKAQETLPGLAFGPGPDAWRRHRWPAASASRPVMPLDAATAKARRLRSSGCLTSSGRARVACATAMFSEALSCPSRHR